MRPTALFCLLAIALSAFAADDAKEAKTSATTIATINLDRIKESVGVDILAIYFMDEDSMAEYKELVKKRQEAVEKKKDAGFRDSDRLANEIKKTDQKMEDMREESGLSNAKKLNRLLVRYIKKTYGTTYAAILDAKANEDGDIIHTATKVEDITDKAIETLKGK